MMSADASSPTRSLEFDEIKLLDGRVTCFQPQSGYRSAIDPILLQAAVAAAPGERVLDLGCGIGAASLTLAARLPETQVVGLDNQELLIRWAVKGAQANNMTGRVRFFSGDLLDPPSSIAVAGFDHVIANPPFMKAGTVRPSPDLIKAAATVEGAAVLADWVRAASRLVRPGGTVTFIHHGDRSAELADLMETHLGDPSILLIMARKDDAKPLRVIVQNRENNSTNRPPHDPLILHGSGGKYTSRVDQLLRGQATIDLIST